MTTTKLTRNLDEAMLGGVLAGLGSQYRWDPTLLRIVAALVTIATGIIPGVIAYLAAWVIIPAPDGAAAVTAAPAATTSDTPTPDTATPPETPEGAAPDEAPSQTTAVAEEISATLRDAADRLGEAASIAADAARQAANEIGEVARRPRAVAVEEPPEADPSPEDPAPQDSESSEDAQPDAERPA